MALQFTHAVNQSKSIFQVITENYNAINAVALERLPEKLYAHLDWSPEKKKTTQILIHQKKGREKERN